MTKEIKTFNASSYEEIIDLIPQLTNSFVEHGLFVIRGYRFSPEEHKNFAKLLGDIFDWNVCTGALDSTVEAAYHKGGQSTSPDYDYDMVEKDHYILDWHIEQIYFVHPPLSGIWYMDEIVSPKGSGNTRFVDSSELYGKFSEEDRGFLSKSIAIWDKPLHNGKGPFYTKVVENYHLIGEPLLRVETDNGCYITPTLYLLDDKKPSDEQVEKFAGLMKDLKTYLVEDESIRYEQVWESGDMLVVDLFRMYHAVMGGFGFNERSMSLIVTNDKVMENSLHNVKPEIAE